MPSQDIENVKRRFQKLVQTDQRQAVRSLNHEALKFTSLFAVREEIYDAGLVSNMNERNQWALKLTEEFLEEGQDLEIPVLSSDLSVSESLLTIHSTLLWMVKTGGSYALDRSYIRVIDRTCIFVLNVFSDHSALSDVIDIIFYRHRKGLYYHHLCWSVFELGNPDCLLHFGKRLLSSEEDDQSLALHLLSCVPKLRELSRPEERYVCFIDWFEENRSFLVYNGESFDMMKSPVPFVPSLEAKYFGHETEGFAERHQEFKKLDPHKKTLLADRSYKLRRTDRNKWKTWLTLSIDEQLMRVGEWLP